MDISKHTPGPLVLDETTGVNMRPVYLVETAQGDTAGRFHNRADALLFIAAPDLLAALEKLGASGEFLTNEEYRKWVCDTARAAIAKAKGS